MKWYFELVHFHWKGEIKSEDFTSTFQFRDLLFDRIYFYYLVEVTTRVYFSQSADFLLWDQSFDKKWNANFFSNHKFSLPRGVVLSWVLLAVASFASFTSFWVAPWNSHREFLLSVCRKLKVSSNQIILQVIVHFFMLLILVW